MTVNFNGNLLLWAAWFFLYIKRQPVCTIIFPVSDSLMRTHMLRWALSESSATRCYASCITATKRWEGIDHYVAGLFEECRIITCIWLFFSLDSFQDVILHECPWWFCHWFSPQCWTDFLLMSHWVIPVCMCRLRMMRHD